MATTVPVFVLGLVPTALGMGLCNPTLTALISRWRRPAEQGLVQGAAGALESLGRTGGPIWGNVVLEHYGEGTNVRYCRRRLRGDAGAGGRKPAY